MNCVTKGTVVYFRYIMKNTKGEVIENTMESSPKCYLHGAPGIHPSLQLQFEGLKAGDTGLMHLDGGFTFDVIIDELRSARKEELMLGYPLSTDHLICDTDCACFNV